MCIDLKPGAVMKEPVEDIGRFVRRGRDDRHVVGTMLVGDVGIEREAWIDAILGVEITRTAAPFARAEELTALLQKSPGCRFGYLELDAEWM